jgi:phosphatidylserine/phosphatidylglycerophosphate/cardiolipin synthase-like enzyme
MERTSTKTTIIIGSDYVPTVAPLIKQAKRSINVLMFDWRWYPNDFMCDTSILNHAFVTMSRQGVKVRAITNYSEIIKILTRLGIEAKKWNSSRILHSKLVIIDNEIVVMGSHNFSQSAMTRNAETSSVIYDKEEVQKLTDYFESLWRS